MAADKMVNMATKGSDNRPSIAPRQEEPKYPYGLRISLRNDEITKLGLTELPKVNQKRFIEANEIVSSVSQSDGEDGLTKSVELQITDMQFCDPEEEKKEEMATKDMAGTLYDHV